MIYEPAEDSYLLQKYVRKFSKGRVLDMGTGSGIQAITAAEKAKEVVAVDVNKEAVESLKRNTATSTNITPLMSDLFSKVKGAFDLIIFNPPYLPQDKGIEDAALYGGKRGWEISQRFLREVSSYLSLQGKILFLFSSLTNKQKIERLISENLLTFKELDSQKLAFETLYVYLIEKSASLKKLERKGISKVHYLTHGRRGNIFAGSLSGNQVVIKMKRPESKAEGRLQNEAFWLKNLNKKGIGPALFFSGRDYLVEEFVKGIPLIDWITISKKKEILNVLHSILNQCFMMDRMNITKQELHRPMKDILITSDNVPVLLDFERCKKMDKPKNVVQFMEFLRRWNASLESKGIILEIISLQEKLKAYKQNNTLKNFQAIIALLKYNERHKY